MKTKTLFVSVLAVLGLTACEKGLVDEAAVSTTGQVGNSVLQVRTRGALGYVLPSVSDALTSSAIALQE